MNPWLDPSIAAQMREKADADLQLPRGGPIHFRALAETVRAMRCPGSILEFGCGVGHNREVLDRAGVPYASYTGCDISPAALALAKERYPESRWIQPQGSEPRHSYDIVVDGSCVLHVDDWRFHLSYLCSVSRRWVILHRLPVDLHPEHRAYTEGYGHKFDAWKFAYQDVKTEMLKHGFDHVAEVPADGGATTLTFAKARHYVTYSDDAYLSRLKTLYASMVKHCRPFKLHVLAWGDRVMEWCAQPGSPVYIDAVSGEYFLDAHQNLAVDKLPGPPRSKVEHYWTCGPQWIADVMEDTGEPVTYLDADLCLFSSPEPVFAEIGSAPAAVVPHGFARAYQGLPGPTAETHDVFGKYNVGLVHFNDPLIAKHWAGNCRDWCYDRLEAGRWVYGDQKYLDWWPGMGAHVIQHPGACLGPWATHTRALDVRDGVIHFGGRPLVSYHFSALKELPDGFSVATRPEYQLTSRQEAILYSAYWASLKENAR